jgi:hypothetical protein
MHCDDLMLLLLLLLLPLPLLLLSSAIQETG